MVKYLLNLSFILYPLSFLLFSCQPTNLPMGEFGTHLTQYTIHGRLVLPSAPLQILATPDSTAVAQASIRLLDPNGNSMATGLTDALGNFSLSPQFTVSPNIGDIYILESAKGTQDNKVSYSVARLRTFLEWTADGWVSISGFSIIISAETTAVSIIQNLLNLLPNNLLNPSSPVIEPGLRVFSPGGSGIAVQDYNTVLNFVLSTLIEDADPIEHVGYNDAGEFYYRTIITRPFLAGDVSSLTQGITHLDAIGQNAQFYFPDGLGMDNTGSFLYVAEHRNDTVRKINLATRQVTTVAGVPEKYGYLNNTDPLQALFYSPRGVCHDGVRNRLYVVDQITHRIRQIDLTSGEVSLMAGSGSALWADGIGANASFYYPEGCIFDGNQYLYIADRSQDKIRRIDVDTANVTTIAGNVQGYLDAATGTASRFSNPRHLAYDPTPGATRLYVSDTGNHRIRIIDLEPGANFAVTTLAGSTNGYANGVGAAARFSNPWGLAFDNATRTLYVADYSNQRIRTVNVDTATVADFVAGGGAAFAEGIGGTAKLYNPSGLALNGSKLYISDTYNHRIREVDIPTQAVTTLAGNASHDDTLDNARFFQIRGITGDEVNQILYVADGYHHLIRKVDLQNNAVSTLAGNGEPGYSDGFGPGVQFNNPSKLVYDGNQFLYVADLSNNSVRRIDVNTGSVSTVNGGPGAGTTADGPVNAMRFNSPVGIDFDEDNNKLFVMENDRLREVDLTTGEAKTVAGGNGIGWQDGPASTAKFTSPRAVTFVGNNVFFLVENHHLRKIDLNNDQVSTVAGTAGNGYLDDIGTAAVFNDLFDVITDGVGNLYLADYDNWRVRRYNISTGEVGTVAGGGTAYPTIDGKGPSARIFKPYGLFYDTSKSRLYVGENSFDYPIYPGEWTWGSGLLWDGQMFRHGNAIRIIE